jgi:hypothetical protein
MDAFLLYLCKTKLFYLITIVTSERRFFERP